VKLKDLSLLARVNSSDGGYGNVSSVFKRKEVMLVSIAEIESNGRT